MTKLSYNIQLENLSIIKFQEMIFPWVATKPPTDTGIDFIVQPYDEENRNEDKSLNPIVKTFEVQLKSTSKERFSEELNIGKLVIDVEHLKTWKDRSSPVMLIRYYFQQKTFFYTWVDEIEIKENQTDQTVQLPYKIENVNNDITLEIYQEIFKENVLDKLLPPKIGDLIYEPKSLHTGMGYLNIENIRNGRQIAKLIQNGLLERNTQEAIVRKEIHKIETQIYEEGMNAINAMKLAILHLKINDINSAMRPLHYLKNTLKIVEAEVLLEFIKNNKFDVSLFKDSNKIEFIHYIELHPNITEKSHIDIIVDNKVKKYSYNDENIYILPPEFNKINSLSMNFQHQMEKDLSWEGKGSLFRFKVQKSSFKLFRGMKIDGKLYSDISRCLIESDLAIESLNVI